MGCSTRVVLSTSMPPVRRLLKENPPPPPVVGGWVRGVRENGLILPAPLTNFMFCRRKIFLMWVGGWVGRGWPAPPPPPMGGGGFRSEGCKQWGSTPPLDNRWSNGNAADATAQSALRRRPTV